MKQVHDMKATKCWYNRVTGIVRYSPQKGKNWLYFASTGEYHTFLKINGIVECRYRNDLFLFTQQKLIFGDNRWVVDFKLSADSLYGRKTLGFLANHTNNNISTYVSELDNLFIEYKGIQDTNFLKKQRQLMLYPKIDKKVILVSERCQAFVHEDIDNLNIFCKNITSVQYLVKLMEKYYV